MKFLAILLCVYIVAVATAVQDPLQHVLQEVEQLKRSNSLMERKVAYLEQKLEMQGQTFPKTGNSIIVLTLQF